jgi:tetratricopeptide (TPR) repeat protein
MNRVWRILICTLSLAAIAAAQTKAPPKPASIKTNPSPTQPAGKVTPPNSREPFVIEHYLTAVRFESNGAAERDISARIRVQSDAGAQGLKELIFGHRSPGEQVDMHLVRVHKADGTVANAAADVVKDIPIALANDAPAYADAKEKRIAVPALHPGDVLEYEIATRMTIPLSPRNFWFQQNFIDNAVVLDEDLKIDVPENRTVILESPGFPHETSHANGRTIYLWKHANLTGHSDSDPASPAALQRAAKLPDVQLTSFANWQDVARWYADLERGRDDPTPEIRAEAQQLIEGRATQIEKVQALYDYVSKSIRYIDIPLGLDGYQPHSAAEVFANQYGDAKDERILLAAMLRAVGIESSTALIPYVRKLDAAVPSPAQLDHVITAVPDGNDLLWMDPTAEVAPFRLLTSPLRDKSALLVSADGLGKIVRTPQDPPFPSTQRVEIDGQVSELGKLTATVHYFLRGDTEFVLRRAFHTTPPDQWKQFGQTILSLDGVHGDATSVSPGDPTDTRNSFEIEIKFTQLNFLDWDAARVRIALPMLTPSMPDLPAKNTQPINLGSPLDVTTQLKLVLPARFTAQVPVAISVARDYAEFKSSYQFEEHTLTATRTLNFTMRELPASRASDYQTFARSVAGDENQSLLVVNAENVPGNATVAGAPGNPAPVASAVPKNVQPDELLETGSVLLDSRNAPSALPLFLRAVELAPNHPQAWNDLGLAYMQLGQLDDAVSSFRKQIEINPSNEHSYNYLGVALQQQQKYDDAVDAYRKQIELNPLDPVAHGALGGLLLIQQRYADAVLELDKATILSPENAGLQIKLGEAYLDSGDEKNALDAFDKGIAMTPAPAVWNDVALLLANRKVALNRAQQYAESAIAATSSKLKNADLSNPAGNHLNDVATLGILWDTLGWVHFQKGDLETAEKYIRASWNLDQRGEAADRLAQIDEKRGKKDQAIQMFSLALAVPHPDPETRARLTLLLGGNAQIDALVNQAKPSLVKLRTFPAGTIPKPAAGAAKPEAAGATGDTDAEFLIVFSSGAKKNQVDNVDAVQFISGSAKLRPLADRLRSLDYGKIFPDSSPLEIIRRGTLSCSAKIGDCNFTLAPAEDLRAAN